MSLLIRTVGAGMFFSGLITGFVGAMEYSSAVRDKEIYETQIEVLESHFDRSDRDYLFRLKDKVQESDISADLSKAFIAGGAVLAVFGVPLTLCPSSRRRGSPYSPIGVD